MSAAWIETFFDTTTREFFKLSLRHFVCVVGFVVFALLGNIVVRGCEKWDLASSQLLNGLETTDLYIFGVSQVMVCYMVTMAAIRFLWQFTVNTWTKR